MYRDLKTKSTRKRDWFLKKVAPSQEQRRKFYNITTLSASANPANSNLNKIQRPGSGSLDGLTRPRPTLYPMLQPDRRNSSDSDNPAVRPALRQRSSVPYSKRKKFLELCVNTGKYTISLGEIAVGDVGTDGELFSEIRKRYYELRPMHFRRLFYHPADIHYVCVSNPYTQIQGNLLTPRSSVFIGHTESVSIASLSTYHRKKKVRTTNISGANFPLPWIHGSSYTTSMATTDLTHSKRI